MGGSLSFDTTSGAKMNSCESTFVIQEGIFFWHLLSPRRGTHLAQVAEDKDTELILCQRQPEKSDKFCATIL
jgi:hypothetical protein